MSNEARDFKELLLRKISESRATYQELLLGYLFDPEAAREVLTDSQYKILESMSPVWDLTYALIQQERIPKEQVQKALFHYTRVANSLSLPLDLFDLLFYACIMIVTSQGLPLSKISEQTKIKMIKSFFVDLSSSCGPEIFQVYFKIVSDWDRVEENFGLIVGESAEVLFEQERKAQEIALQELEEEKKERLESIGKFSARIVKIGSPEFFQALGMTNSSIKSESVSGKSVEISRVYLTTTEELLLSMIYEQYCAGNKTIDMVTLLELVNQTYELELNQKQVEYFFNRLVKKEIVEKTGLLTTKGFSIMRDT